MYAFAWYITRGNIIVVQLHLVYVLANGVFHLASSSARPVVNLC